MKQGSRAILFCYLVFTLNSCPKSMPLSKTSVHCKLCMAVLFSSVAQSCLTLCDPMDCSTPGFPVHHQLPELAQTHVYRVGDKTIQGISFEVIGLFVFNIFKFHPISPFFSLDCSFPWLPPLASHLLLLHHVLK